MSDVITVELADSHDPVRRALDESETATRSDFFKKAIAGGGALAVGGLAIGGLPSLALGKPSAKQDVAILNFALLLEYLESEFYVQAVDNGALTQKLAAFATTVRDHELAHVKALKAALGSKAGKKPAFDFGDTVKDPAKFAATSIVARGHGRRRLQRPGHAPAPQDAPRRGEHRLRRGAPRRVDPLPGGHARVRRRRARTTRRPAVLDAPLTKKQVEKAVAATGFIKG